MMEERSRDELRASWARVEADLLAVLDSVEVTDRARRWVLEFLDHNELGLAFEFLVDDLVESEVQLDDITFERLERVAREMGVEDASRARWLRSRRA